MLRRLACAILGHRAYRYVYNRQSVVYCSRCWHTRRQTGEWR